MDRFFHKAYQWFKRNKLVTIFGLILCFSILGLYVQTIRFEEDITKLIPIDKENEVYQKVLKTANFSDKIIVNITQNSQASIEDLIDITTEFTDSLSLFTPEYILKVQGKVDEDDVGTTLDFVHEHLPLFLSPKDYEIIGQKLNKDSIEAITQSNYKSLMVPSGMISRDLILKDPLGMTFLALKNLQQSGLNSDFTLEEGYVMSPDKKHILLFITPSTEANETKKNSIFAKKLNHLTETLNQKFEGKASISLFGSTLVAVANANQIKTDIQFTVGIAVFVLLFILVIFYRRFHIPIILFIPTLFGGLLALSVLCLVRDEISAISLGIGSVLLGITIDYSLHILTHIRSNNNVQELYKAITQPILMSSLTTALAFLCLLFLRSQALQDLGLFASISVLGASVFALIFIPQVYSERKTVKEQKTILDQVASHPLHKSKAILIVLGVLLLVSFFTYNTVSFNNDLASLNYEPQQLKEAEIGLDNLMNSQSKSIYLVTYGVTQEDALQKNDRVYERLQELKKNQTILRFNSVGGIVDSKAQQRGKIERWEKFWSVNVQDSVAKMLMESGSELGFKLSTFQTFYEHLKRDFTTLEPSSFSALNLVDPNDFINSKEGMSTVSTLVKMDHDKVSEFKSSFQDIPNTVAIDRQETSERFLGYLKSDFNHLIQYSLIVILLLLFLFYRSVSLTLVTALPICLTWLLTIGIMGVFGLQFNIFNIIISTFIFGLGIDYSIFVTNGMLHHYRTGEVVLNTYKTSIILSVITTILGIGVLIFAKHPALHSISLISVIGILSALIIAFALQPLLFKLFIGDHQKRPISTRHLIHSSLSFGYFGLIGLMLSALSVVIIPLLPISMKRKMPFFHKMVSKFMKSVLYTNPFVSKKVLNPYNEAFEKQAIIIANHSSFLDILSIGMLHPKIIFLVNDWVYNSPVFGRAVRMAGFYPVSDGLNKGLEHLKKKIDQGYSLAVFPEGTRSYTHKMKRFHKGAFLLAETFNLDILPVLIHGNSEVLPKGTFIIKDGSITLKLLKRIKPNDPSFGNDYSVRTKAISQFFKASFRDFRKEMENEAYFHPLILEEFRYKGKEAYSKVKQRLKQNGKTYFEIINELGASDRILNVTDGFGELNNLMALDGPGRTISSFVPEESKRTLAKFTVSAGNPYKVKYIPLEEIASVSFEVLILDIKYWESFSELDISVKRPLKMLILLHEGKLLPLAQSLISNLQLVAKDGNFELYKNE